MIVYSIPKNDTVSKIYLDDTSREEFHLLRTLVNITRIDDTVNVTSTKIQPKKFVSPAYSYLSSSSINVIGSSSCSLANSVIIQS